VRAPAEERFEEGGPGDRVASLAYEELGLAAGQVAREGAALPAAERSDLLVITYLLAGRRFPADC
jgi:hypothetical protein